MLEPVFANHPMEYRFAAEMEEESHFQGRSAQVAEELDVCPGMEMLGRLGFNHDLSVDNHVECLPSQGFATVVHHYGHFAVDLVPLRHEVPLESQRINEFAVPEPECTVHVTKGIQNRAGDVAFQQWSAAGFHA